MVSIEELQLAIDNNLSNQSAQSGSHALRLVYFKEKQFDVANFKKLNCTLGIYFSLNNKKYACFKLAKRKSLKFIRDLNIFHDFTVVHLLPLTFVLVVKYFQTNPLIYDLGNIFTTSGLDLIKKKKKIDKADKADQADQADKADKGLLPECDKLNIEQIVEKRCFMIFKFFIEEQKDISARIKTLEETQKHIKESPIKDENSIKYEYNDLKYENPIKSEIGMNHMIQERFVGKQDYQHPYERKILKQVICN